MGNGIDVIIEEDELEVDAQPDFLKGDKGDKRRQGGQAETKEIEESKVFQTP